MTTKIHYVASYPHYADHIEAIWRHLPAKLRGVRRVGQSVNSKKLDPDDIILVAGFPDIGRCMNHRLVYVEHGHGQSYRQVTDTIAAHYHGGAHPEHVVGYIGPRQDVIDAWGRPGYVAGSPICDPYQLFTDVKMAALCFHWNASRVSPEARSALPHYVEQLPQIVAALRRQGYEVVGTRHPRMSGFHSLFHNLGIPDVTADEVRRSASLLVCDNSSMQGEMAYLMRDQIVLNAPWYRRDIDHGLRFWSHIPGPQVDGPGELVAYLDGDKDAATPTTHSAFDYNTAVYGKPHSDGSDGLRAAAWLSMFVAGLV